MMNTRVLVITDNVSQYNRFRVLLERVGCRSASFEFMHSPGKSLMKEHPDFIDGNREISVRKEVERIIREFDLVLSFHCKQFFPPELVNAIRCINIHPGYNPINRGWYPQVFAIIHQLEVGATIHEMDELLDHGDIIDRIKVTQYAWDTSLTLYERILEAELDLLEKNLQALIDNTYTTIKPETEGVLYLQKNFHDMCKLPLDEQTTFQECINRLRALTHGDYKNAYFIDPATNKRTYVSIQLTPEA